MLLRVVRQKFTDISKALAVSIIRAINLMMEAASIAEASVIFYQAT
jgi:hypothetical protein